MKEKILKIKNLIKDKIKSLKKEKSSGKNDSIGSSGSIILTEYFGIDTNQSSDTIKQEEIGADQPRGSGGSGGTCGAGGGGGVVEIVHMGGGRSQPQDSGYRISGGITIFNNSDKSFVDTYKCGCGKKIDFTYSFPRANDFRYSIREQSKQD